MHKLTQNRMTWGRCALLAGVAFAGAGFLIGRPYFWLRQSGSVVSFDGRPTSLATVYRAFDGKLLLWIREPWGGAAYIVYPSKGYVLQGHGGSILHGGDYWVGPLFALNKSDAYYDGYLRGALLHWPSEKLGLDPRVVFQPGYVEFTEETDWKAPGSGRRVRVRL